MPALLVAAASFLLFLSAPAAWAKKPAPAPKPAPHGHGAKDHDGAAIYARYCALCHAEDRSGYAADHSPSLRSPELMGAASGGYLWNAISYGRPGTPMAAFAEDQGGPLSHDQQHALLDWLIETAGVERAPIKGAAVEGDVVRGAAVYAEHCADCHGAKGEGGTGTALGNPVFLATVSDAFVRYTIAQGRTGTPMKGFADTLPATDLDAVTAFLRSRAAGWEATTPRLATPPDPESAILNPDAPPARLEERAGRFVSADSVAAAMSRGERMVLLDARPMSDWQRSHLPGALPVPFYDGIAAIAQHLPRDGTPIIAYCACPHAASGRVVDALTAAGFTSARILDEGVLVWAGRGHPLALGETR
ncbi:MAG: c-type cytochrome [Myxococcota bacterium]|nr:c-type cytochrome [Myxococcota bacterium]